MGLVLRKVPFSTATNSSNYYTRKTKIRLRPLTLPLHITKTPTLINLFITLILCLTLLTPSDSNDDWCYEGDCGPASPKWPAICRTGKKQSPINIATSRVQIRIRSTRITLNRNYVIPKSFYLRNNGHTVELILKQDDTSKCYLIGDGLGRNPYYFSQLHFHWGPNNLLGSEHRISGKSYPLEMHMVHRLKKDPNKLAVLSVLFYISPRDNINLQPIISNLNKVVQADNQRVLMPPGVKVNLTALLPKKMRMFRYIGSLTTPPCTENVVWTVFRDPVPISKKQMANFRKLLGLDSQPMTKTFRPVQPTFTSARRNIYFLRLIKSR